MIEAGVAIFSVCPVDDDAIKDARRYIKQHDLTKEDVKIQKTADCVYVETIKQVSLRK